MVASLDVPTCEPLQLPPRLHRQCTVLAVRTAEKQTPRTRLKQQAALWDADRHTASVAEPDEQARVSRLPVDCQQIQVCDTTGSGHKARGLGQQAMRTIVEARKNGASRVVTRKVGAWRQEPC